MQRLYEQVFENNKRWADHYRKSDPAFFDNLSKGQEPEFLYIGCADSRVPPSTMMGLDPGQAFVHRNVANLVVGIDVNVMSVIQYAVTVLHVKHVVVCGHYGCGGVKAAMQSADLGLINKWLREVRDVYRLHQPELDGVEDEDLRYRRLVELNVREQCMNVIKTSFVQQHYLDHGYPQVHGWVYDLETGLINDLDLPFEEMLEKIREVYRLTPHPPEKG